MRVGRCCRVEWAMWTSSNDGCGRACDRQGAFKRDFQATAVDFEKVPIQHPACHGPQLRAGPVHAA